MPLQDGYETMLNHPLSGFSENKILSFKLFKVLTKIQAGVLEMHGSVGGMKIFESQNTKGIAALLLMKSHL